RGERGKTVRIAPLFSSDSHLSPTPVPSVFSVKRMPVERILSIDDPRVWPYRNLKDRELARQGGFFIAEGEHVVRRLLDSDYPTQSLLLAERRVAEIAPVVPDRVPIYAAP